MKTIVFESSRLSTEWILHDEPSAINGLYVQSWFELNPEHDKVWYEHNPADVTIQYQTISLNWFCGFYFKSMEFIMIIYTTGQIIVIIDFGCFFGFNFNNILQLYYVFRFNRRLIADSFISVKFQGWI